MKVPRDLLLSTARTIGSRTRALCRSASRPHGYDRADHAFRNNADRRANAAGLARRSSPCFFSKINRAVDRNQMHALIDLLSPLQNLIDVQMLLRVIHHLQNHASLPRQANSLRAQRLLQTSSSFRGIESFAGRSPVLWCEAFSDLRRRADRAGLGVAPTAARRHCT